MGTFFKCSCEQCGTHLEFPADAAGSTVACPHCQGQTRLREGRQPPGRATNHPAKSGSHFGRLAAITIVVLVAGSLGGWAALKRITAKKLQNGTQSKERPAGLKEQVASSKESVPDAFPERLKGAVTPVGDIKKGRDVYMGKCAKCHQFYDPAAYNDFDWNHWLGRMRGEAKLNGEQAELLNRFLVTIRNP